MIMVLAVVVVMVVKAITLFASKIYLFLLHSSMLFQFKDMIMPS